MKWSKYSIRKITIEDKNYPKILKKISNFPQQLFYRGNLSESFFKKSLAVVGSRRVTNYGKTVVERFVSQLVAHKVTIISGFMYGIDTEAHSKSIEYGGTTVAVFASGLNEVYPSENEELYTKILEKDGLVLSEYEPDAKPHLWTYPARNRIVAGLASLGVLVVEAGEGSGSLITAKLAREQGKKVFAVPGPVTSVNSSGVNNLIKEGLAKLVTEPEDILGSDVKTKILINKGLSEDLTDIEVKITSLLKREQLSIDELSKALKVGIIDLSQILSIMSLKGLINEVGGKYYI